MFLPNTARKLMFANEEREEMIQTVRCKEVEKYIA